jgi:hypothetical protein
MTSQYITESAASQEVLLIPDLLHHIILLQKDVLTLKEVLPLRRVSTLCHETLRQKVSLAIDLLKDYTSVSYHKMVTLSGHSGVDEGALPLRNCCQMMSFDEGGRTSIFAACSEDLMRFVVGDRQVDNWFVITLDDDMTSPIPLRLTFCLMVDVMTHWKWHPLDDEDTTNEVEHMMSYLPGGLTPLEVSVMQLIRDFHDEEDDPLRSFLTRLLPEGLPSFPQRLRYLPDLMRVIIKSESRVYVELPLIFVWKDSSLFSLHTIAKHQVFLDVFDLSDDIGLSEEDLGMRREDYFFKRSVDRRKYNPCLCGMKKCKGLCREEGIEWDDSSEED